MNLLDRILLKLFRPVLVRNYKKFCGEKKGHALLYYKTDSLLLKKLAEKYIHTNFWEVLEIAKILNGLGYWVDILGRNASPKDVAKLEDTYDVFIGIGAGDSGRYYAEIAAKLTKAVKIFYAAGPEPDESNRITVARHDFFKERHPDADIVVRRTITLIDMAESMKHTDVIFSIGNEFSMGTYKKFNKPIYRINPSTAPKIRFDLASVAIKSPKKFLYFGGNGNITKGLDLLIEAFQSLPDLDLYVCAPHEADVEAVYKDTLPNMKNIHWIGFIPVGEKVFNELTAMCAYSILPSASEGIATSMANCMRRGMIPVATYESGIDTGDFGHLIPDIHVPALTAQIRGLSQASDEEIRTRVLKSYHASFSYTQAAFSQMFEEALIQVLLPRATLVK